jgi:hypothetical protein
VKRRATEIDELSCGIDRPHAMTSIDEIHLPLRVHDNRRAWMRDNRLGGQSDEKTAESEHEQPFRHDGLLCGWSRTSRSPS